VGLVVFTLVLISVLGSVIDSGVNGAVAEASGGYALRVDYRPSAGAGDPGPLPGAGGGGAAPGAPRGPACRASPARKSRSRPRWSGPPRPWPSRACSRW